jgi:hypothetical protein
MRTDSYSFMKALTHTGMPLSNPSGKLVSSCILLTVFHPVPVYSLIQTAISPFPRLFHMK